MAEPAPNPATNTIDVPGVPQNILNWAGKYLDRQFRKYFGRSYSLEKLERVLTDMSAGNEIPDKDVVELAVMYAHYLHHVEDSRMASELLLIYLNRTSPSADKPATVDFDDYLRHVVIPSRTVRSLTGFDGLVCSSVTAKLEQGIKKRIENPDALHPVKAASFDQPDGSVLTVEPAVSQLPGGGAETIYVEVPILLPTEETSPIKQALGKIGVVSEIALSSSVNAEENSLSVEISSWRSWGWDLGDFNWEEGSSDPHDKDIQPISLDIDRFVPSRLPKRQQVIAYIQAEYSELLEAVKDFRVKDKYLKQVANKVVTLDDGEVYQPQEYKIFVTEWTYTPGALPCPFQTVYELKPPEEPPAN